VTKNTNNGNGSRHLTHVMIDGELVPFTREIALQFAQQTHLLALGNPKRAAEMLAEAQTAANNGAGSNGTAASSVSSAGTVA
jgi:hypothetical protein